MLFWELHALQYDFEIGYIPDFELDLSVVIGTAAHFDKFLIFHLIILNICFFSTSNRLLLDHILLLAFIVILIVILILMLLA